MSSWLPVDWDSFAKSAGDAAETTRLMALRASKQAEIMYCESSNPRCPNSDRMPTRRWNRTTPSA